MVQLLFARLPQFKDDATPIPSTKRVKGISTKNMTINNQVQPGELLGNKQPTSQQRIVGEILFLIPLI